MNQEQFEQGKVLLDGMQSATRRLEWLTEAEEKNPSVVVKNGVGRGYEIFDSKHHPEMTDTILRLSISFWEKRLKKLEQEFADL